MNSTLLLKKLYKRNLQPVLTDLKFAIALLLIIALFSITGTVIEQGETLDFYEANYPLHPALFGFLSYKVILAIGLNHVYSTWWFLSILVLFGTSLIACTFSRQLPMLKVARRWSHYTRAKSFEKLPLSTALEGRSLDQLAPVLAQKGYRLFQTDDKLYARKGLVGRIGPIIVHASMILILLGAIGGALTGFVAQEMIPSGQTFAITNITEAGIWARPWLPKDWLVRVNRFWIDYTPGGTIDQFYSDLSVLDKDGNEVDRKTIHVNEPLRYKGVTLYQANWDVAAIRFQVNQSPIIQLPMTKLQDVNNKAKAWGTWLPTKPDLSAGVTLITPDLQGTFLIYGTDGQLMDTIRVGGSSEINGVTVKLKDVIGSTGLQIKADPGVPIVYAGFGLLMLGVVMSYVSYSQIWALQVGDRLYVGGKTNRAQVGFEAELLEIIDRMAGSTPSLSAV
ncbi:Cytochrome c biogenesis protein ccs1 [Thalassoporum mexicanum PCC 7367]|uniref:cytochrome c biogenesis protein n=1 Tax=Thalassoporum mexicanum TaxID=3457544 RepID=UPI00029FC5FC|nr:cytochrome c biogenesis protein [Pseudanabaena sp. PCC 7367]AFY69846.1 Cytochrome c biogenesis protein ccs1 [Pseudanabaena sp. PCC 7367]